MNAKRWEPYAQHILESIAKIRLILSRGDIREDVVLYDATLRNLQTLSEATRLLPDVLKDQEASIPWKEISGFRNILVHNYLGTIDPQTVKDVIDNHLAPLQEAVHRMLNNTSG